VGIHTWEIRISWPGNVQTGNKKRGYGKMRTSQGARAVFKRNIKHGRPELGLPPACKTSTQRGDKGGFIHTQARDVRQRNTLAARKIGEKVQKRWIKRGLRFRKKGRIQKNKPHNRKKTEAMEGVERAAKKKMKDDDD